MDAKLDHLRRTAVERLDSYLVERRKAFQTRGDFSAWAKQQYAEMQAEHAWLNAKQDYKMIELYNVYGQWEPVPSK
ncbi:MAG: hypothetical protein ABSG03_38650 [Bryobacteraceae bacterium]|jgi:hypothetical protein